MATASDLISGALGWINVLGEGQELTGEQENQAFVLLNQMLSSFGGSEGFITYQYDDPEQDLVLDDGYELMFQSNLAVLLAPFYGKEASPTVLRTAMNTKRGLKRATVDMPVGLIDRRIIQWNHASYDVSDVINGTLPT